MDPRHHQPLVTGAGVEGLEVLQRDGGGVNELGSRLVTGHHVGVNEAGGPDDDVSGLDDTGSAQAHQVRSARSGTDENDPACSLGDLPPRYRRRLDGVVVQILQGPLRGVLSGSCSLRFVHSFPPVMVRSGVVRTVEKYGRA